MQASLEMTAGGGSRVCCGSKVEIITVSITQCTSAVSLCRRPIMAGHTGKTLADAAIVLAGGVWQLLKRRVVVMVINDLLARSRLQWLLFRSNSGGSVC